MASTAEAFTLLGLNMTILPFGKNRAGDQTSNLLIGPLPKFLFSPQHSNYADEGVSLSLRKEALVTKPH